jgi:hypothetical protein
LITTVCALNDSRQHCCVGDWITEKILQVVDTFGALMQAGNQLNYAASSYDNLKAGFPSR